MPKNGVGWVREKGRHRTAYYKGRKEKVGKPLTRHPTHTSDTVNINGVISSRVISTPKRKSVVKRIVRSLFPDRTNVDIIRVDEEL